ncbi:MAG: YgeY family selenium metabolism-linked hydrolase [Oscillibacter sp.]|nr:YgeY family selenium metabolism-linked hydrolase [Oscillibacter sp.]
MDLEAIKRAAEGYRADMSRFLREMIAIPSESCDERGVILRIRAEMEKLGFDKIEVDGLGNVIGWMGTGSRIIAIDSHVDTVGVGNAANWEADPYEGYETDDIIFGRGGSDQEGGMASAVYGVKIMKDLGLIPPDYTIMVVGSVQEEDCDGMCWQYLVNKYFNGPEDARERIEFVISTEPTDGGIYRGHRGRMEIRVDVKGVSCHGSAPERGDNAIYKMADIVRDIRALNENGDGASNEIKGLVKMLNPEYNPAHYEDAQFLGRGTCTVSEIFYTSPSRCAVADGCSISVDRRMTAGETWDGCLDEIRALPSVKKYGDDVKVSMYLYDRPAWTGEVYETECFFPTWINKESAAHVQALVQAHKALFGDARIGHEDSDPKLDAMHLRRRPLTDKWTWTSCVSTHVGAEAYRPG